MRTSNFDIKQGLPDNTINCIAQDNRGFVWTGTTNGLAQFDGLFFTLFRYSNTDPTTISNNNVHSLLSIDGDCTLLLTSVSTSTVIPTAASVAAG